VREETDTGLARVTEDEHVFLLSSLLFYFNDLHTFPDVV
jgi:hypothetical protein